MRDRSTGLVRYVEPEKVAGRSILYVVVACFKDVAAVGETVEQGGGHLCVAEHGGPFTEA